MIRLSALAALIVACATPAMAHVTASPTIAYAGAYTTLRFSVGHGCADKYATTALRLQVPADVKVFRPQPKAGWVLTLDKTAQGQVTAVTWRGRLEPDQFDEFGVMIQAPNAVEPLLFPAIQTCETGENRWIDPPAAMGDKASATPAPMINILASPAAVESHDHAQ
jgi:periplasmic copper chaperone A